MAERVGAGDVNSVENQFWVSFYSTGSTDELTYLRLIPANDYTFVSTTLGTEKRRYVCQTGLQGVKK